MSVRVPKGALKSSESREREGEGHAEDMEEQSPRNIPADSDPNALAGSFSALGAPLLL